MATVDVLNFQKNLKAHCAKHGAIQQLANAIGVSRVFVSNICNGKAEPGFSTAFDIARALGVDITELTSPPPSDTSKPKKRLRKVS